MLRKCIVCGADFESPTRAVICSPDCRRARRRTYDAGCSATVGGLPPPERACEVCGKTFTFDRGPQKACSPECLAERRKIRAREAKRRELADPEKRARILARARERRKERPGVYQAQDARKWERQKEIEAADPAEMQCRRQKAREHYAKHKETIQAKRRARMLGLSDAELAELTERMRVYSRDHRRRERSDPEKAARRKEYQEEYRRRRAEAKAADDVARLAELLAGRENAGKIKPCAVCGKPVVGRSSLAKVCSKECRRRRTLQILYPPRPRPCVVCGTVFDSRTCAKVCSPECQEAKRRGIPLADVPKIQRRPEQTTCDVCGTVFHPWQKGCSPACMRAGRMRRRLAKTRKGPFSPRPCAVCGREFAPSKANGTLCGPECRAEHKRQTMRQGPFPSKPCVVCGTEFTPLMEKAVVCSKACRRVRRRELENLRNQKEKSP